MSRLFVITLFAAATALSWPAGAEAPAPRTTLFGAQVGIAGGASLPAPRGAVNAELARAGWPAIPAVRPAFQLRFGLMAYNVSLDIHFGGDGATLPGSHGEAGGFKVSRGAIGVDLGYRLQIGRWFALSPHLGVSSLTSTLCFAGRPDSTSWTSRPPFEQILRNPGKKTCLKAGAVGLDAGLWFGATFLLRSKDEANGGMLGYISLGPRAGYVLPLSAGRTWEQAPSSERLAELPPFQGPAAPLGGGYAGIEIEFRFAVESWPTGRAKAK